MAQTLNFAQPLAQVAQQKFAELLAKNRALYCQFIACATYCDQVGIHVHQYTPEELAERCHIETIDPVDQTITYPAPPAYVWRLFFSDDLITQWVQQRFDELLNHSLNRLQLKLATQETISDSDQKALRLFVQLQKSRAQQKVQPIILAYWAPLSGHPPNQTQATNEEQPDLSELLEFDHPVNYHQPNKGAH